MTTNPDEKIWHRVSATLLAVAIGVIAWALFSRGSGHTATGSSHTSTLGGGDVKSTARSRDAAQRQLVDTKPPLAPVVRTATEEVVRIIAYLDHTPANGARLYRIDATTRVRRDRPPISEADTSGVILVARSELEQFQHVIRHEDALPYELPADIIAGTIDGPVTVNLRRGCSLLIRTQDLAREPLEGVRVTVGLQAQRQGMAEEAQDALTLPGDDPNGAVWTGKTGPDGVAVFRNLPAGSLTLRYEHPSATVHDPRSALSAKTPDDQEKTVAMATMYGVALRCEGDHMVYVTGMLPSTGGIQPTDSSRAREYAKKLLTQRFPGSTVLVTAAPVDAQSGKMPKDIPVSLEVLGRHSGWTIVEAALRPVDAVDETLVKVTPGLKVVTAKIVFRFCNPDGSLIDYRNALFRSPPGSKFVQGDLILPGASTELAAGRYLVIMSDRAVRLSARGFDPRTGGTKFEVVAGEDREINIQLERPVRPAVFRLRSAHGPLERAFLKLIHPSASGRDGDNRFDDVDVTSRTFWMPADEDVLVDVHVPGFRRLQHRISAGSDLASVNLDLVPDA